MHVVGQLVNIMLGKVIFLKYSYPSSLVVGIVINGIQVQNALINLDVAINVMTKDIMQHLNITNLRPTPTILQLADSLTIKLDGMVEDLVVTLDSWEYLVDFMILSPKATLGGYPIILGRPWLAKKNAFIGCRSREMTILDGMTTESISLYLPAQPQLDLGQPVWSNIWEETNEFNSITYLMAIERDPFL